MKCEQICCGHRDHDADPSKPKSGCKFHLWGERFWNNFFHPRHKGIVLVIVLLIVSIIYNIGFLLLACWFEAFSDLHASSYIIMFVSNVIILLVCICFVHFLTLDGHDLVVKRCTFIYVAIAVSIILGVVGIIGFVIDPETAKVQEYVQDFYKTSERVPRIMALLQQNEKCCGIENIMDYTGVSTPENVRVIYRVPDSCCVTKQKAWNYTAGCGYFRGDFMNESLTKDELYATHKFYTKGCFVNKATFSDMLKRGSDAATAMLAIRYVTFFNPVFAIVVTLYYCYYVCFALPREDELPQWAEREFRGKLGCFFPKQTKPEEPLKDEGINPSLKDIPGSAGPESTTGGSSIETGSTVGSTAGSTAVQSGSAASLASDAGPPPTLLQKSQMIPTPISLVTDASKTGKSRAEIPEKPEDDDEAGAANANIPEVIAFKDPDAPAANSYVQRHRKDFKKGKYVPEVIHPSEFGIMVVSDDGPPELYQTAKNDNDDKDNISENVKDKKKFGNFMPNLNLNLPKLPKLPKL